MWRLVRKLHPFIFGCFHFWINTWYRAAARKKAAGLFLPFSRLLLRVLLLPMLSTIFFSLLLLCMQYNCKLFQTSFITEWHFYRIAGFFRPMHKTCAHFQHKTKFNLVIAHNKRGRKIEIFFVLTFFIFFLCFIADDGKF